MELTLLGEQYIIASGLPIIFKVKDQRVIY